MRQTGMGALSTGRAASQGGQAGAPASLMAISCGTLLRGRLRVGSTAPAVVEALVAPVAMAVAVLRSSTV